LNLRDSPTRALPLAGSIVMLRAVTPGGRVGARFALTIWLLISVWFAPINEALL